MKKFTIILIFLQTVLIAEKLDIELFGDMSKIKIAINKNTQITVTENYYKRYIDLDVKNPSKNFKSNLLAYNDNIIEDIKILKETKNNIIFRIFISKINFFYDYRIENGYFIMPIGLGLKIIPLKTNHNLIFVPYFFNIVLPQQEVENLSLDKIYSDNPVAQKYNEIIKYYSERKYSKAQKTLQNFMKTINIDEKSKILLMYLDAELDFRLRNESITNCTNSLVKFKNLIEKYPDNPYNDRAVVFMYLCSKENDASSDSKDMIKELLNNYPNSPYYYRFLYEDALNDYDNGKYDSFKFKLKTIMSNSNDKKLKMFALYKLYGFYLSQHDVATAYELIQSNADEYLKYKVDTIKPYFMIAYGDSLFFNGKFSKARKIYQKLIKTDTNISLIRYAKVRISDTYLYEYKYDKAEEYFQKNKKFFNGEDIASKLARIRLDEYEGNFYEDDDLERKFNIMQQYLQNPTLREELIFREGQIYFYKEEYLKAYIKIKQLLDEYPKTTLVITAKEMMDRIIYAAYLTMYKTHRYTAIYQLYSNDSEIIKLHPEYYNLSYMIINSLNELEQYKKLTQFINDILNTKLPFVYEEFFLYKLAYAYLNEKSFYKAFHVLNYIKLKDKNFSKDYRNYKFLGDYHQARKNFKKALKFYNKAINHKNLPQKDRFKILNRIAVFFFKKRAYSPALKYYIKADKIKTDKEIKLKIAEIYYYMGEYDKAIILLNNYLKNFPDEKEIAHIYYKIGMSWINSGYFDKGIFILKNYLKDLAENNNGNNPFWKEQIEKAIEYETYKNNLKKLNEIKVKREGL